MKQLKNWWFTILGAIAIILDSGFDVINPFLHDLSMSDKWINILKVIFAIYSIVKIKLSLPTQNADKLKEIVRNKISSSGEDGGGKVVPGKAP